MEEQIKVLRVSDVIDFSETDYKETKTLLKKMNGMVEEYVANMDNPVELEALKRRFNSNLMYLATYYAKILCFRSNFEYLEEARKATKSEAMKKMMEEDKTLKVTNVEKMVYAYPYYNTRIVLIEKLKAFFYLTQLSYKVYEDTQRSIYQSLSTVNREYQATIS
jgi:hypothetical protein